MIRSSCPPTATKRLSGDHATHRSPPKYAWNTSVTRVSSVSSSRSRPSRVISARYRPSGLYAMPVTVAPPPRRATLSGFLPAHGYFSPRLSRASAGTAHSVFFHSMTRSWNAERSPAPAPGLAAAAAAAASSASSNTASHGRGTELITAIPASLGSSAKMWNTATVLSANDARNRSPPRGSKWIPVTADLISLPWRSARLAHADRRSALTFTLKRSVRSLMKSRYTRSPDSKPTTMSCRSGVVVRVLRACVVGAFWNTTVARFSCTAPPSSAQQKRRPMFQNAQRTRSPPFFPLSSMMEPRLRLGDTRVMNPPRAADRRFSSLRALGALEPNLPFAAGAESSGVSAWCCTTGAGEWNDDSDSVSLNSNSSGGGPSSRGGAGVLSVRFPSPRRTSAPNDDSLPVSRDGYHTSANVIFTGWPGCHCPFTSVAPDDTAKMFGDARGGSGTYAGVPIPIPKPPAPISAAPASGTLFCGRCSIGSGPGTSTSGNHAFASSYVPSGAMSSSGSGGHGTTGTVGTTGRGGATIRGR